MSCFAASRPGVFLTAQWRHMAMLSYEVEPAALEPYLPPQVELDFWNGNTYVSLVGFMFLEARLLGIPIPFHRSFPEVNLRFYVVRRDERGERHGVVFIREIAPRWCVSAVARRIYNESYLTLPMRHRIETIAGGDPRTSVEYAWRYRRRWNGLRVETAGPLTLPSAGSLDEFIVEHYWAYTRQRDGGCFEYFVKHPPWRISPLVVAELNCHARALYGAALGEALDGPPKSVFLSEGSAVAVHRGVKLDQQRMPREANSLVENL